MLLYCNCFQDCECVTWAQCWYGWIARALISPAPPISPFPVDVLANNGVFAQNTKQARTAPACTRVCICVVKKCWQQPVYVYWSFNQCLLCSRRLHIWSSVIGWCLSLTCLTGAPVTFTLHTLFREPRRSPNKAHVSNKSMSAYSDNLKESILAMHC